MFWYTWLVKKYSVGGINMEPIFLHPYFREKIWGGNTLKTDFNFDLPSEKTGEAWVISGHQNGQSTVTYPEEFRGQPFKNLFENNPELFGIEESKEFPLLIKILDAQSDLSVQVHPDDQYAKEHENDLGKTECWYILSAEPGSTIVYGHHAQTEEEFNSLVKENRWDDLLREIPVKAGEFYYVPHGTIHAIGGGITILETQQSSDTTYRVYDYDRKDDQGNGRELHIEDSITVSKIPHQDPQLSITEEKHDSSTVTHFLTNKFFSVYKWDVQEELIIDTPSNYTLGTVIDGSGQLFIDGKTYNLKKGAAFVLPKAINQVAVKGDVTLIVSNPE